VLKNLRKKKEGMKKEKIQKEKVARRKKGKKKRDSIPSVQGKTPLHRPNLGKRRKAANF